MDLHGNTPIHMTEANKGIVSSSCRYYLSSVSTPHQCACHLINAYRLVHIVLKLQSDSLTLLAQIQIVSVTNFAIFTYSHAANLDCICLSPYNATCVTRRKSQFFIRQSPVKYSVGSDQCRSGRQRRRDLEESDLRPLHPGLRRTPS